MRYETSVTISRPIEDVWEFILDPFNMPRWNPNWLAIRPTSPAPFGLGSTFQARMAILGFEARARGEIVEWEPPRAVSFTIHIGRIASGLLRGRLEATEAGTRMVRVTELEPRPVLKPLFWIASPLFRRRADAYNQTAKRALEDEAPARTAD